MSEVDRKWIKEMFVGIGTKDWTAPLSFFHPDMVCERPGYEPFIGREDVMCFYREKRVSGSHTPQGTIAAAGKAADRVRIHAVRTDGSAIGLSFAGASLLGQGTMKLRRSHFFVPAV